MGNESLVYCVVKNAKLRKRNGEIICTIPFRNQFRVLEDLGNGELFGEAYCGNKFTKCRGFVKAAGFTKHEIVDMSYLHYRNATGQRIPTTIRYKGMATGWIDRNEVVNVIVLVDGWMLTGKGWTKAEWLQKDRDIVDYEGMKSLVYAVITQTVKDYTAIIRKLQSGGRYVTREYDDVLAEIKLIRQWFHDGEYLKVTEDSYSGTERLAMIDNELGVTAEWIKQILSKKKIAKS